MADGRKSNRPRSGSVPLAFFGTTASMIAVINNVVGGACIALLTHLFRPSIPRWVDAVIGVVSAIVLTVLFYAYQRWRFSDFDTRSTERKRRPA
jgi:prepilin signal peptidase PulO-like enzyme (type II secretory pathway)